MIQGAKNLHFFHDFLHIRLVPRFGDDGLAGDLLVSGRIDGEMDRGERATAVHIEVG